MLGAFFMATDMVTTPLRRKGLLVFGIGCGLLTVLIRFYGGYPEGVCYSILLMNTVTPLIDRFTEPKVLVTEIMKIWYSVKKLLLIIVAMVKDIFMCIPFYFSLVGEFVLLIVGREGGKK